MKTLLTFTLSLLSLTVFGATPSFSSFDTNNFFTSGNKITIINVPYSAVSGAPSNILVVTNLSGNAVVQSTLPFIFPGGLNPIGYNEIRVGGTNYPNFDTAVKVSVDSGFPIIMSAGWFPFTNVVTNVLVAIGPGSSCHLVDYVSLSVENPIYSIHPAIYLTNGSFFSGFEADFALPVASNQVFFGTSQVWTPQFTNAILSNITTTNAGESVVYISKCSSDSQLTIINPNWFAYQYGIINASVGSVIVQGGTISVGTAGNQDTTGISSDIKLSSTSSLQLSGTRLIANNTNSLNIDSSAGVQSKTIIQDCYLSNINNGVVAQTNILCKTTLAGFMNVDDSTWLSAGRSGVYFISGSTVLGKQIAIDTQNNRLVTVAGTYTTTNLCGGTVVLATGNSVYYITNSLISANSGVIAACSGGDLTASNVTATTTTGLITLQCNAITTGNLKISWMMTTPPMQ